MSHVFSTRCPVGVDCPNPVLTVSFPTNICPGPNSVVLANGAVVDLNVLGNIVAQFCPDVPDLVCGVAPTTTQGVFDIGTLAGTTALTGLQVSQVE